MLTWLARKSIRTFQRTWEYDTHYLEEVLDEGFDALSPMMGMQKISSYQRDIPSAPYYAAKIVAVRAGDCGPCLQLVVRMAERAGVDPKIIDAVLRDDIEALPDDVRLVASFAGFTIARDFAADPLREEIVRRWGKRALISLSYAIASGGFYPAFKWALGHGHACTRVHVGGHEVAVKHEAFA